MGYLGGKWYIMWKFGEKLGNMEKNWKFLHCLEKIGYLQKKIGNLKTQKFGEKKIWKVGRFGILEEKNLKFGNNFEIRKLIWKFGKKKWKFGKRFGNMWKFEKKWKFEKEIGNNQEIWKNLESSNID